MKKPLILLSLLLVTLLACTNQNKEEEEKLFKEVMEVHDAVMPEMGKLRQLSKSIQAKMDSTASDTTEIASSERDKMEKLVKDLEDANESMMEWMRQFEQVEEGTPHGEVMQYLKEQKQAIDKVRDDMLEAKKEGEYYLGSDSN